ncbi:hypothetical protein CHS0354_025364 [Potamilus streckersoni]|uniref:Heat shock 70 kDa protein 12A n=1 Tax=Potamilus streckersoni TaxID=2493646 RepID=A0AAE0VYV4_9BIVA|nr:hypothetical protein CHS0354_025364 [Potamilus streckersoni]
MEPDLVIALDIGTTYSGYACQFRDTFKANPSEIWMNSSWGQACIANKTKTCLLLTSTEEMVCIGDKAEFEFFKMYDQDKDLAEKNYLFFKNFKLILYKEISEAAYLAEDYCSRRKSIKLVMSKFIEGLVKHCIEKFSKRKRISINEDKVRWVITVPAIWNENAKSVMRKAAEMAGIPGNQLILALEPEAAAVNCLYLSVQERSGLDDLGRVGDRFMVIDLGGGTIDITAVEVVQDTPYNRLKEIVGANGGAWGGQRINEAFQQACHDTFKSKDGKSVFIKCRKADLLKMENEFERQKLNIVEGNPEWIEFQLPHDIRAEIMEDVYQEPNKYSEYFEIKKGGLFFNSEIIRDVLFQETLKMTVQHIHEKMGIINAAHVRKFILVGGFAESPIVIEEMQRQFPDKKMFVVINPFYAVMRGAVLFGHEPNILQSRISRFTFGVNTHVDFNPNVHPSDKRWVSKNGKIYAKDVFSIHVKIGETVSIGETRPPVEYAPVYPDQTSMRINVYQSTEKEPMYITDPSCKKIGYLDVLLLKPFRVDQEKKAEVSMVYGGTELTVKGIDKSFDIPYKVTIKFTHEN